MHPAFGSCRIVCKAEFAGGNIVHILERDFHHNLLGFLLNMEDCFVYRLLPMVVVPDKRDEPAFKIKRVRRERESEFREKEGLLSVNRLLQTACINNADEKAFGKVCLLAHMRNDAFPYVLCLREHFSVCFERHDGSLILGT